MDEAGFALAQSLRRQMSPAVMVLSTPRTEESCQRNGLSFVDLMRPFCSLGNINVPVRTASEQSYRLTEFHLRMFYSSDICQLRTETAEEYLVQVVNDSNDAISGELDGNAQDVGVTQLIAEADSRAPAFQEYSREFMRTLAFSEHEAVDHPVACVLLVSSSDANPISKFVELYSSDNLPALLNEGTMDPKLLKLFVILHDNQDGPVDRADELLLEMRSNFGVNNCRVLCINSAPPDSQEAAQSAEDMWGAYSSRQITRPPLAAANEVGDGEKKGKKGLCINKIDVEELTDFVLDLSVKHVIPLMEVKIRTLHQQVSATRKGLKNQIKNLWLRKGKDDVPDVLNGPLYTYSSMESQIRVLADYSFMLQDYELALSNYRLLSSDYKTDKAWKRYAGVQEMIGLSLFMLDQSRRESELCMETAINYYQKSGRSSASYATRSSLWLAEMHKAKTQYREAAVVLSRASAEEATTRAGLLLEQAAYCYLHTTPPMLRKYGFHLVLAGNQYANCFQRKLAAHVYRNALNVFGSRDWTYIHDHVYFHLGRLATLLGNHANAVLFFKRVIASSRQSPINQAKFLAEFLFVIQSTSVQGSNLDLDLPIVDVEHVEVHVEDQRTYASPAAASVTEKVWSSLEDGLVPGPEKTVSTTWLDKTVSAKKVAEFSLCVAGEEIGVDVEFRNPLQIALDVSDVSLVFEFAVGQSNEGLGAKEPLQELKTAASHETATGNPGETSEGESGDGGLTPQNSVTVSKEEFTLQPGEKSVVRLKTTPLEAGVLKVVGVRWTLSGIATGQRDFAIPKRKEKAVKKHKRDEPTTRQRLNFHVLGNMPRLDVSLHEIPGKVNAGEVRRLVLELSNPSTAVLKAIRLKTSHPLFLLVGEAGDLDQEFPSCLEVQRDQVATFGRQEVVADVDEECSTSGFTFSFPEGAALEGGSTLLWPLWLHAREAGTISLNTVIYYEPDKSITSLPYRTVRLTHTLQVLPSLKIGVQITPSPLQLQQFLLRLDIENKHSSESFWLRQVSCAGNQWSLAPLPPPIVDRYEESEGSESLEDRAAFLHASVCPSQLLPAGQSLSLFFKLLNVGSGKLPVANGLTKNIGLGPPGSTEPLIDITSGPLPRFLLRERLEQPQPSLPPFLQRQQSQKAPGVMRGSRKTSVELVPPDEVDERPTVDVVLISEQQDGMAEQQDGTTSEKRASSLQESVRVVVHDVCHCSVHSPVPLVWVLEGPKCVGHDFASEPSCEVPLLLMVRNCSIFDASVRVETFDAKPLSGTSLTHTPEKRVGWYSLGAAATAGGSGELPASVSDSGGAAALAAAVVEEEKVAGILHCGPYMWCNSRTSSSIPLLRAGASAEVPLRVTFFGSGTYDLSRYQISWSLLNPQNRPNSTDGGQSSSTNGSALQQTAVITSPQKQDKSSKPTFASGFAAAAAAAPAMPTGRAISGTRGSPSNVSDRSPDRVMSGTGQGHSLLLTVLDI